MELRHSKPKTSEGKNQLNWTEPSVLVAIAALLWNCVQQRQINKIRRSDRIAAQHLVATLDSESLRCIHFRNEGTMTLYGPKVDSRFFLSSGIPVPDTEIALNLPPNTEASFSLTNDSDILRLPDFLQVGWSEKTVFASRNHFLSVPMVEVKRAYVERARSHEGQARS